MAEEKRRKITSEQRGAIETHRVFGQSLHKFINNTPGGYEQYIEAYKTKTINEILNETVFQEHVSINTLLSSPFFLAHLENNNFSLDEIQLFNNLKNTPEGEITQEQIKMIQSIFEESRRFWIKSYRIMIHDFDYTPTLEQSQAKSKQGSEKWRKKNPEKVKDHQRMITELAKKRENKQRVYDDALLEIIQEHFDLELTYQETVDEINRLLPDMLDLTVKKLKALVHEKPEKLTYLAEDVRKEELEKFKQELKEFFSKKGATYQEAKQYFGKKGIDPGKVLHWMGQLQIGERVKWEKKYLIEGKEVSLTEIYQSFLNSAPVYETLNELHENFKTFLSDHQIEVEIGYNSFLAKYRRMRKNE